MTRSAARTLAAIAMLCLVAKPVQAQLSDRAVELFRTYGGVAGATPVHVQDAAHVGAHGGLRFDGGIQGARLGIAIGLRLWELAPTQTYGGRGLDLFTQGEWRSSRDARTAFRATAGAGFDELDPGRGPYRDNSGTQGFIWSAGVVREVNVPSGALVALSLDLVMPHVNADIDGRRKPILELGFGYRDRFFTSITMPGGARR